MLRDYKAAADRSKDRPLQRTLGAVALEGLSPLERRRAKAPATVRGRYISERSRCSLAGLEARPLHARIDGVLLSL
jgi:hypothetical protein